MIWLREGDNIVGYAPMLKKEYSDDEIHQMSKFSYYEGWSQLSRFVMEMQGIEYEDDADFGYAKCSIPKPIDACSDFTFECSWEGLENKECMKTYIKQIYDVFQNLKLYRIQQYSIANMHTAAKSAKEDMKLFISNHTIESMYKDIERKVISAENFAEKLKELLNLFSKQGYPALNLFHIPSDDVIKHLNAERKTDKKLVC